MGIRDLTVLLLAVDCVDVSLDVNSVSLSSSGSELVDFWELLVGSLDSLDLQAGQSGIDASVGLSASSWTAG